MEKTDGASPDGLLQLHFSERAPRGCGLMPILPALPAAKLGTLAPELLNKLQRQRAPCALIPAYHLISLRLVRR